MQRDPQKLKNLLLTGLMSGRSGTILVIIVTIVSLAAASCAAFAAWRAYSAAEAVGAFDAVTEPSETEPPQTEPSVTEPDETEPPQTETSVTGSAETEQPVTEPDKTDPPGTGPHVTAPPETEPPETDPPEPDKYVVCVDAGHGYDDPGTDADALGDWSEKDITLDIALRLGAILEKAGCEVAYTRTDDKIPDGAPRNSDGFYLLNAYDREKIIRSLGQVDAFVSIHCDSYDKSPKINGARIFYYTGNSKNTAKYAGYVADGIKNALKITGLDGVTPPSINGLDKENAYYVTKCTDIPSVLVETGFVTNERDVKNMLTEEWRQNMAQGIADGILRFLDIRSSGGSIK